MENTNRKKTVPLDSWKTPFRKKQYHSTVGKHHLERTVSLDSWKTWFGKNDIPKSTELHFTLTSHWLYAWLTFEKQTNHSGHAFGQLNLK